MSGDPRWFADLHTHSRASFDSLASPASLVRTAASRGLTHLAITDHDRIDGALEARDRAAELAPGLIVIVGEEIKTADGDLIGLFLDRAIEPGLTADETIAEVRRQGGLVGIPHPFDRFRGSLLRDAAMERLASLVDWVEGHNGRVAVGRGNELLEGVAHGTGGSGQGEDRAVVRGVGGEVEPPYAGDAGDRLGQSLHDFGTPSLADIGHAFDDRHGPKGTS